MRRDFVTTRVVLAVAVVASVVWLVLEDDSHHRPAAPPASSPGSLAPTFAPDLTDTGVQALWQQRRCQLADLARALDAESDSARADSLRREIEQLITRTEHDVKRRLREPAPAAGP